MKILLYYFFYVTWYKQNKNELTKNNNFEQTNVNKMFNKIVSTYILKRLRSILLNKKITIQLDVHEVHQLLLSLVSLLGQERRL